MTRALMTGVSGLRAHQQQLDVVANNLANMNTIGYKSQKVAFSDLMYNTLRPASNATDNFGGTNPHQVGTGVLMSQITRHFNQGALQATGEVLDFAIQGSGFFVLAGPQGEQVFSRAGSFALDGDGNLVDPSTGYLVQRMGDHGEPTSEDFGFQVSGDQRIRVPLGAVVPGEETTQVDFFGNLPSDALPPLAEVLSSLAPFSTITGPATGTTRIDELTIHNDAYGPGDQIEINGTNPDGTPFSSSINAQNATMQDIVDAVNAELVGAVAELQPNGILTVTADETGEAFSSLIIQDAIGNVGGTDFSSNAMFVSTEGKSGDVFETTMEIFDQRGNDHAVQFSFEKEFINGWHVTATLTDGSGEFIDNEVGNLWFNEDGTFALAGSDGDGDTNITIDFNSLQEPLTIDLNFRSMSHMATNYSLSQTQDGTPPGTLVTIAVSSAGELSGLASNGKVVPLAQFAIADFANDGGLDGLGSNYFRESLNSGSASIGSALTGGRGQIIGNQLENSNVDIAQEFTQLIVAQRGFSANARTITVADEVLEELTNIIR